MPCLPFVCDSEVLVISSDSSATWRHDPGSSSSAMWRFSCVFRTDLMVRRLSHVRVVWDLLQTSVTSGSFDCILCLFFVLVRARFVYEIVWWYFESIVRRFKFKSFPGKHSSWFFSLQCAFSLRKLCFPREDSVFLGHGLSPWEILVTTKTIHLVSMLLVKNCDLE